MAGNAALTYKASLAGVMLEGGLIPDLPTQVLAELDGVKKENHEMAHVSFC